MIQHTTSFPDNQSNIDRSMTEPHQTITDPNQSIPGTGVPAVPGTAGTIPLLVIPAIDTGGGGGGFGFTFGGGIGNVSGDVSYSEAYGTA
jgi:hypothetical protein